MSNIYQSTKVLPYVYLATNLLTGEFYYGYRYANKVPSSSDIGIKYFSSSKKVSNNKESFQFSVIAEFFESTAAYDYEQELIRNSIGNKLCLNKAYVTKNARKFHFPVRKPLTEKRKKNMSIKGKIRWAKMSKGDIDDFSQMMASRARNSRWVNNGYEQSFTSNHLDYISKGWSYGRLVGNRWVNNGHTQLYTRNHLDYISKGWSYGGLERGAKEKRRQKL